MIVAREYEVTIDDEVLRDIAERGYEPDALIDVCVRMTDVGSYGALFLIVDPDDTGVPSNVFGRSPEWREAGDISGTIDLDQNEDGTFEDPRVLYVVANWSCVEIGMEVRR